MEEGSASWRGTDWEHVAWVRTGTACSHRVGTREGTATGTFGGEVDVDAGGGRAGAEAIWMWVGGGDWNAA
jgi:hypothetical protein